MARDFDFRRVTKKTERSEDFRSPANQPTKPQPVLTRPARSKSRGRLPLTIGIIGLAAAAIGAYYWSTLPIVPTTEQSSQTDQSATSTTSPTSEKSTDVQDSVLVVQIYQSGASQETIDQVTSLLKSQNLTVENLGNSQFEYDKTYVWHATQYADKAKEIGDLLVGQTVSYKESQNAGLFDILIYLGKQ